MKKLFTLLSLCVITLFVFCTCAASAGNMDTGFSDVSADAWYADAVQYLNERDIMIGTGSRRFSPDDTLTRAMTATVLYRVAGEPAVTGDDSFTDTESGTWYSDAVLWASQNGIVGGYGNDIFGTNDPVTQEQLTTILWRYAGEPQASGIFRADGASDYAVEAIRWAKGENITSEEGGTFQPKSPATRAQVAETVYRYLEPSARNKGVEASTPGISQTGWTEAVPAAYTARASQQGSVERLDYTTKDYVRDSADIQKTAYVYLPYGYDPADSTTRYNIFYLMHGWGGSAGEFFNMASLKNLYDNLIEKGDMEPTIIVSATFYSEQSDRDFSGSIREFRQFHRDFEEALMPAVEGKFHTYAQSTSDADLKASRDHRAFGGFSLGSVTTWLELCYDYDYIRYFLPMSGSCWYYGTYGDFQTENNVDFIEQLVADNNLDERGYFVYATTGTQDNVRGQTIMQMEEMLRRNDVFTPEHVVFYQKDGGYHDFNAVQEYLYNALPLFFKETSRDEPVHETTNYTAATSISDVMNDPAFGDYGRLIFPVNSSYYSGETLGDLRMTWYNNIDPDKTVEICNYMKDRAEAGETIFYDIYTEAEKAADPAKRDTGLFFFKGDPGAKFAICNAGGGHVYVGAMHDSFPHALELSKKGYHAFALIYRPGWSEANEDLARAISFVFAHADELGVDTECYSLWGGSAGARIAAYLGSYGPAYYGGDDLPRAGTVVMQYTGHSEYQASDPPTFACVGTSDGIASWRTMQSRIQAMSALGIPTEFYAFEGLPHGFGLGTDTVAEGWIDDAVAFWESNM